MSVMLSCVLRLTGLLVVQLVRRWRLGTLCEPAHSALYCHNYSVRALAAGPIDTLVSGDSSGEVSFWRI